MNALSDNEFLRHGETFAFGVVTAYLPRGFIWDFYAGEHQLVTGRAGIGCRYKIANTAS